MKAPAILAGLAFLSTAFALPGNWDKYGNKGGDKKGDKWGNKGTDKWSGKEGEKWDDKEGDKWGAKKFTSSYSVVATPDQVVDTNDDGDFFFTGGLKGAKGYYNFDIDSKSNTICYDITLYNFRGTYESAANTATHIHEASRGETGPPRIAFPNPKPTGKKNVRKSKGCLKGPFSTGIIDDKTGKDTGAEFSVKQIEANPAGFFADVHSSLALPGAVRGQLA